MTTSPTLGLTLMTSSQAQKEVLFNEFLLAFDSLYRGVVISSTLTSPPGSPSEGDCYIIAGSPSGAWSGQANNITFYFNGWQFITAKNEMRLYDEGSSCWRVYHSGSSTWDAEPASTVSVLDDLTNVEGTPTDGQVLTYRTSDSHWKPQTPVGDGPSMLGVNVQTASYTLVLSDAGKLVTITDATANNLTIPLNSSVAFPVDTVIEVQQGGAGTTTLVATAGVTLVSLGGVLALPGQYAIARLVKTATDVWTAVLSGTATAGILTGLTDVNITTSSGVDGYLVYWNNTAGKFELKAAAAGSLSGLTDVTVTEGSGIDGYVLYWNNGATKWEPKALSAANVSGLATVATSGAYGDLTGTPSLASVATSGAYSDLSGTPSLASVATSGNYSDLSGTPSYAAVATSGNYSDLSGTPSNSSYNLVDLGDVNITEGSGVDGYVVYWNNGAGKYELKAPAGGSTSLAGDSDVSFSTLSAHELLVYGGSTWGNETLTALIDATFGSSQGDILYRGSSGWTVLAPGTSGNYLMTQGSGANPVWDTVTAAGDGPSMFGINVQTGDYTLVLTDAGKIIDMRAGSTSTLTVPPNSSVAFPVGTVIQVHSGNTGIVTIAEGSGVDIHAPAGLVFPAKYFTATLTKNYTDVWSLQIANLSLLQQSADVSMSLGSGVDGYVVYWNNGASKFELKSSAGGYTSSGTGYLYNGSSDTNWQQGINLSKFSLSHAGAATSLQTVHGAGGSGPDGWAVGATGSTSIIETVGSTASAYVTGAGGLTIDTSLILGSSATLSNFKLSKLNDVNVTEGSGIDGYVLTWNNATSKWIAAAASGGSTLAGDTDVSISSPTDGQVLTYNGSKWANATPAGGALLPPQYELGPFAPPDPSWFTTAYSTGLSGSLATQANRGMQFISSSPGSSGNIAVAERDASGWGSAWTLTARVVPGIFNGQYPQFGLALMDSSGKLFMGSVQSGSNAQAQPIFICQQFNDINTYHANVNSIPMGDTPYWIRLRVVSSTVVYFGVSFDGLSWVEHEELYSGYLSGISKACLLVGNDSNSSNMSFDSAGNGVLVTYWDDPDHAASGHEALTSANLENLADVAVTSPTNGQALTFNATSGKWENATPAAGGGANPPSLTTFSSQYLSSGVSVSTNYVAGKGLTVMRTDNQGSDVAAFQGTTVPGTTPWTVTMQVRQINMGVGFLRTGLGLYDTSSTKALALNFNNQSGSPNCGMFTLNSGMSGYANTYGGNSIEQYTPIPEWFQISFDGTTYTGAISWDGGTWFTVGTVTTSTLGWTATHIGMMIETYGGGGSGKGGAVALNYAVT